MSLWSGSVRRVIAAVVGVLVVVVGGFAVYDFQLWCERHDYKRHFND